MKTITVIFYLLPPLLTSLVFLLLSHSFGGWVTAKLSPFTFQDIPDMTGKVVLVTGINSGIGKVTALQLALRGATVIGTVRTEAKGMFTNDLNKSRHMRGRIIPMILDLASLASVSKFALEFLDLGLPTLDIVILNAAVMMTPPEITIDGYELQFQTNHLGHFLLIKLLTDKIVSSKSRVIHVSSIAHSFTYKEGISPYRLNSIEDYNAIAAYGQSKLANILFSNELAKRLAATGATSNSLHPGAIVSSLMRYIPDSFGGNEDTIFKKIFTFFHTYIAEASYINLVAMNTDDGALTQLYAAVSPDVSEMSGKYFNPVARLATPSEHACNSTLGELLWDLSEQFVRPFV